MIGTVLRTCAACLLMCADADNQAASKVVVLDGPEVQHLHDALNRVTCPFRSIARLDSATLSGCQVLVLSGKKPPLESEDAKTIKRFAQSGGAVLAIGGGATWMIQHELFDAEGYYPSGTTIHHSTFHGYHRLTFGYPGAKPEDNWTAGVPMLLRATEGPLMELGPRATSILGCGGPYSIAAFERIGGGLVLMIGADPQGGSAYHSLDKPTLTPGDKLKTDRLLENAVVWLGNRDCNIVPNSGFEENTDLPPVQSNWQITLRGGATSHWCRDDAPDGDIFLRIVCPQKTSSAVVEPYRPLVVERGAKYRLACLYKSSIPWTLDFQHLTGAPSNVNRQTAPSVSVPASDDWKPWEAKLLIPKDVSYAKPTLTIRNAGELWLDRLTVHRATSFHAE
jgi:hypothetical protein